MPNGTVPHESPLYHCLPINKAIVANVHTAQSPIATYDTTPAWRRSSKRASRASSDRGTCGRRGLPTDIPIMSRAAFAKLTPPDRAIALLRGNIVELRRNASARSPRSKAVRISRSVRAAQCPTTETNPVAPTESHGMLMGSSPE